MADNADVTDAPAAPVADPIMDIFTEGEQDAPKVAPSTTKTETPEVAEGKEGDLSETPTTPEVPVKAETDSETTDKIDDTVIPEVAEGTEAQPQGKGLEQRTAKVNAEIRDLVAQRNALKTEIEKINGEVYQPATEDELTAQGLSPTDAKLEALSQRLEVQDYNNRVAEAQLVIESESQRVITDFPMFNPQSPDYRKDIAEEAAALMTDSLEYDQNTGQIVGSKISPYRLYKTLAASHSVSAQAGQLQGQQDTEKMLARADNLGGTAPKVEKKDPIMDIFLSDDY